MTIPTKKLNFVFFGTPDVSSKTLDILKSHGYVPSLIVTAPDRPVGRHFTMTPSPTKVWAEENNIPFVHDLTRLADANPPRARGEGRPDLFIVVAYGKILSQAIIDMPKLGTLNIHYSLLPKYRGASPVESAILNGDIETGVSIQKMVFKLDAGPVIAEARTTIDPNETHTELRNRLIPMGAELLAKLLSEVSSSYQEEVSRGSASDGGVLKGVFQDESQMTHCGKIKKEDGLVNPFTDNSQELWNKYRAYYGWPGIYFFDNPSPTLPFAGEGAAPKRIKITKARFENDRFIIEKVIREGKPESNYE
jgi:methionyl-tRNA formyltransferase